MTARTKRQRKMLKKKGMSEAEIDAFLASDDEDDLEMVTSSDTEDDDVVFGGGGGGAGVASVDGGDDPLPLKAKRRVQGWRRCATILDVLTPILVILMVPAIIYATRPSGIWATQRREQLSLVNETSHLHAEIARLRARSGAVRRRLGGSAVGAVPCSAAAAAPRCPDGTTLFVHGAGTATASAICRWSEASAAAAAREWRWVCPAECRALGGDGVARCIERERGLRE